MMDADRTYYTSIEDYHALAEDSHQHQMFEPGLLTAFVNPGDLVLDVAGGTGFNAEFLRVPREKYVCLDFSRSGLTVVLSRRRGSAVQCDCTRIPIRDHGVDVVLCSWSLEHFLRPGEVLAEMLRVLRPGGRIMIWGPNWDNIFRKDFPQFAHRPNSVTRRARWKIFLSMIQNEFLPFRYRPYVTDDVAAFVHPEKFISNDHDATHCVLLQETVRFFTSRSLRVLHISNFTEWSRHVRSDAVTSGVRSFLRPLVPFIIQLPLLRWFVLRFPLVLELPQQKTINHA